MNSSVIFSSDELILMSRFLSIKLRTERSREEVTPETNSSVIISSEELNLMSGFLSIKSSYVSGLNDSLKIVTQLKSEESQFESVDFPMISKIGSSFPF